MVARVRGMVAVGLLVLTGGGVIIGAANVDKAVVDTDGRRKAAENGVREIKVKSKEQADRVRPLYVEAASRNNAWLDMVCQAIQQGASAPPDVSVTVEPAASALVAWRSHRGGNEQKRSKAADALKDRLRWRSWEEVQ